MHEGYLAQCILNHARAALPVNCLPSKVDSLLVRVGKLDAVSLDALQFMFDAQKNEAGFVGARLEIEHEDVICACRSCGTVSTLDQPIFICPQCASPELTVESGRGITLLEMTLTEESIVNENSHSS